MPPKLINQTIAITGVSRGLGAKLAEVFWAEGANLLLIGRHPISLSPVKNQTCDFIPCDLSQSSAVQGLASFLKTKKIDMLINNAAIQGPIGPSWENDWQAFLTTQQVNLFAPIELMNAVIPGMIQRKFGKILNISGGGATGPRQNFSAYAVSKTGLVRFSETLAAEVKPYNISVNCIAPGIMKTALLAEVIAAGSTLVGAKEYQQACTSADTPEKAAHLGLALSLAPQAITGKLISAIWDPWESLPTFLDELINSDIYTLRRITPQDRGHNWN